MNRNMFRNTWFSRDCILSKAKSFYERRIRRVDNFRDDFLNYDWKGDTFIQQNETLENSLLSRPCFIARLGSVELGYFLRFLTIEGKIKIPPPRIVSSIIKGYPPFWKIQQEIGSLQIQAGVFPYSQKTLNDFGDEYGHAVCMIDTLLSWLKQEEFLFDNNILSSSIQRVNFRIVEQPFMLNEPWTLKAFEGKKILVISPFAPLIEEQYHKKSLLFSHPLLPEFDLKTIMAENTAGMNGNSSKYKSWKEALDSMKEKICNVDFDIAMLGCGAYAVPLGAFCKEMGKSAITTCGATSLYFGIYGKRWEKQSFINKYWIRPDATYRPVGSEKIENGAYW